jgi:hypothetical protein
LTAELFHDYLHRLGLDARAPTVPPAPIFREFVALERAALDDETSRRFWIDTLAGAEVLSLPGSEPLPAGTRAAHTDLPVPIPPDLAAV